jgi:ABC-type sugar transport system ATPase subunit
MEKPLALSVRGVSKSYGSVVALARADLDVEAGTIHGLVGENGAGKSTFSGIISGRIKPSTGTVELFGSPAPLGSTHALRKAGVATIYQELTIIPAMSTQANVFLGVPYSRAGFLDESKMRADFRALCERFQVDIPTDVAAGRLSIADQQLLELMRALHLKPRFVLYDEPTAALTLSERRSLIRVMGQLRGEGVTQLIVSHGLGEILEVSDNVTVFRNGRIVQTRPAATWTRADLASEVRGGRTTDAASQTSRAIDTSSTPALAATGLTLSGAVEGVDLSVRPGEILGIAGVVGAGRTTTLRILGGATPKAQGTLALAGRTVRLPRTPRQALRLGIGMIPDDRKDAGIFANLAAADNAVASDYLRCSTGGFVTNSAIRRLAKKASSFLTVPDERLLLRADKLSGGNQQKLLFARWRHRPVRVLLADEPTRGVDIGAKEEIAEAMRALAADGMAIILTSTELEDLSALCDRIIVMVEGRVTNELVDRADMSEERLIAESLGVVTADV